MLIATSGERLTALRSLLGGVRDVELADMVEVGANPARIIPVWRDFLATTSPRAARCAGWASRSGPAAPTPSWPSATSTSRC